MPPAPPPPAPPPRVALAASPAPSLDAQRWRRRVVLAFAPSVEDARLIYQRAEFRRLTSRADTRDLLLVTVAGMQVSGAADEAGALRDRFHIVLGGYRTFLLGKDGHAALTSASPIPAELIARAIDAMPMRRDEVRRRR